MVVVVALLVGKRTNHRSTYRVSTEAHAFRDGAVYLLFNVHDLGRDAKDTYAFVGDEFECLIEQAFHAGVIICKENCQSARQDTHNMSGSARRT
jgi:hypothetical protein